MRQEQVLDRQVLVAHVRPQPVGRLEQVPRLARQRHFGAAVGLGKRRQSRSRHLVARVRSGSTPARASRGMARPSAWSSRAASRWSGATSAWWLVAGQLGGACSASWVFSVQRLGSSAMVSSCFSVRLLVRLLRTARRPGAGGPGPGGTGRWVCSSASRASAAYPLELGLQRLELGLEVEHWRTPRG